MIGIERCRFQKEFFFEKFLDGGEQKLVVYPLQLALISNIKLLKNMRFLNFDHLD